MKRLYLEGTLVLGALVGPGCTPAFTLSFPAEQHLGKESQTCKAERARDGHLLVRIKANTDSSEAILLSQFDVQIRVEGERSANIALVPLQVRGNQTFAAILNDVPPQGARLSLEVRRKSQDAALVFAAPSCQVPAIMAAAAPRLFPWPPPPASAEDRVDLPKSTGGRPLQIADLSKDLERALGLRSYQRRSFHVVPGGFALVTQLEQINPQGRPGPEATRWSAEMPIPDELGWIEFVKGLFRAPVGRYRTFVFVASDRPWSRDAPPPEVRELQGAFDRGDNGLPPELGAVPLGSRHALTILVYEFTKASANEPARFVKNSTLTVGEHLKAAGLFGELHLVRL